MKHLITRAAVAARPYAVSALRVLFGEAGNEVERAVQHALRSVAAAVLARVSPA